MATRDAPISVTDHVPGQLAPLRQLLAEIRKERRMPYTIATVTDDTPATLEYSGYRGLVLLDHDGLCLGQYDDMETALIKAAQDHGVGRDEVDVVRASYEEYGAAWDVVSVVVVRTS